MSSEFSAISVVQMSRNFLLISFSILPSLQASVFSMKSQKKHKASRSSSSVSSAYMLSWLKKNGYALSLTTINA